MTMCICYVCVLGIDVSLSSSIIEEVSSVKGCNYSNVLSEEDFVNILNNEFDYSVTNIAFDIITNIEDNRHTSKKSEWSFIKGIGMAELNNMKIGGPSHISSLFPSVLNKRGEGRGALTLYKLKHIYAKSEEKSKLPATTPTNTTTRSKRKLAASTLSSSTTIDSASDTESMNEIETELSLSCSYVNTRRG